MAVNASYGSNIYSQLAYESIEDLSENNILFCTAAGNDGWNLDLEKDANGNGILDAEEDLNGNGILDWGEDSDNDGVVDIEERRGVGDIVLNVRGSGCRCLPGTTVRRENVGSFHIGRVRHRRGRQDTGHEE